MARPPADETAKDTWASVEKSSITSQSMGFDSNLRHTQLQGGRGQELVCTALPTSLLSSRHGLFLRKLVFQFGVNAVDPLRAPTFETGFGWSFFPSRIPEPQKSSSTSSIHGSQLASHSAPYRSGFGLSLASMQQVSNQRLLDLGLADWCVPEPVLFARAKVLPLLVGVLAEPIGAVPPSGGRPLLPKSGLPETLTATSRFHKASSVPGHRPANVSTSKRTTSNPHEIANKLRMPNGSANSRLESELEA